MTKDDNILRGGPSGWCWNQYKWKFHYQATPTLLSGLTKIHTFNPKTKLIWYPMNCGNLLKKVFLRFVILAIHSSTRSLQSTWFWVPAEGTNRQRDRNTDVAIYQLIWPRGQFSEDHRLKFILPCKSWLSPNFFTKIRRDAIYTCF